MSIKCLRQIFGVQIVEISLVTWRYCRLWRAFNALCGCGLMGNVIIALIGASVCISVDFCIINYQ